MKPDGGERAKEQREDDTYFRVEGEREPQRPIEEQRFAASYRNLTRSRYLIANAVDELAKANGYLKGIRLAAWLTVALLIVLVIVQFWPRRI